LRWVTGSSKQALVRDPWLRLRVRAWPILQTAAAAVGSWYLAKLLLPEEQPVFASIAAVIALGATYGQRSERALELIGGVVLGIGVADLLVRAIGTGPAQIGVMVLLAMSAAVVLGGGPVLVTEAAVSAILLVVLEPTTSGLAGSRVAEALVGAGLGLPTVWLVVWFGAAMWFVGGLGHGTKNVLARTLIQERVPHRLHGRAFAAYNGLRNGAELFALAGGGVLVATIGARSTLALAGAIPVAAALVGLALYARSHRPVRDRAESLT
jgi:hypothetical protein